MTRNQGLLNEDNVDTASGQFKHPLDLKDTDYDLLSSADENSTEKQEVVLKMDEIITQNTQNGQFLLFMNSKNRKKKLTARYRGFQS